MRINKELLEKPWTARWIFDPEGPVCDFGVFHFRKKLHFRKVPRSFVIHVSADNRYYLLVNGKSVSRGPCRGDLNRWFFETVDIAPFLHAGENVIAAIVWNFGIHRPLAQITFQTRFLLQGNSKKERIADTRTLNGWKSFYNKGYAPYLEGMETSFIAVGPGEKVDGKLYPWGWEKEGFDDTGWSEVKESLPRALPREDRTWGSVSYLVPRPIPLMVKERGFFNKAVLSDGIEVPDGFICGREEMEIPAESRVSLILDNGVLTTAYPEMEVSGGKGSSVIVCYAESLNKSGEKGNRNEIEGKTINGLSDCFMPDGGEGRVFNSLWWRAFRYVQVKIATGREPLRIKKFSFLYTGYPFIEKGSFKSNDAELKKIWDAGWRTARLCAHETYMDCPYYEQLQYIGDTRIQALISLYVSGDDRLMKKAIRQFNDSRLPDGLTLSQYPSFYLQVIPPFSLIWINMLNDYYRFRDDPSFIREMLPGVRAVLRWFEEKLDAKTGLLGPLPWWNFVDWARKKYRSGVPPGTREGNSSVITLLLINSLLDASDMEAAVGDSSNAKRYKKLADRIKKAVVENCGDERKGLLADTPAKKCFSQHANVLAVLTGTLPRGKHQAIMKKVLEARSLMQCTYYFQFYLHAALKKAGMGDLYVSLLKPWRNMLAMGLTTFAETPEPTRSDCHAWSAHPNVNLLAIVCGISPAEPGFRSVKIEPSLGPLEQVEGSMPHPAGMIKVKIKKKSSGGISAEVTLPKGLDGVFIYRKKKYSLRSGKQFLKALK